MIRKTAALIALALFSTAAFAHPDHGHGSGFVVGLMHPFTGLDHALAMLAIGVWAAQWRGRTILIAPAIFVASMVGGALFALNGGTLLHTEHGVALSVLTIGLLVAFVSAQSLIARWALPIVAIGAMLHGYAHATETPATATSYVAGFVIATLMLHIVGIFIGLQLKSRSALRRMAGIAVAIAGSLLALGAV